MAQPALFSCQSLAGIYATLEANEEILEKTINRIKGVSKYGQTEVCVFGVGRANRDKIIALSDNLQDKQEELQIERSSYTDQNEAIKLTIITKPIQE